MNTTVNYIRQRLSLRKPLAEALELTSKIVDKLSLQKPPIDPDMLEMFIEAESATEFCKRASEFTLANGGKPWKYVMIPHSLVDRAYSFDYLLSQFDLF